MKVLIACIALIAVVIARPQPPAQTDFATWKLKYNKIYESEAHETARHATWMANKKYVDDHNSNGQHTFTLGMNEYADMESDEFVAIFNGYRMDLKQESNNPVYNNISRPSAQSVDWRSKGAVTGVKNQGHCGSCWSFSATGSLEGQHFLKTGKLVSLSEQQLVDCSTKFGNHGCKGGLMDLAFKYLATVAGDELEEDYPYTAEDGFCRYEASKVGAGTKSHTDVTRDSESALINAVTEIGPISIAMDAGHKSFQLYHEGVYTEPECSSVKLDHGVLLIGFGTDSETGKDYWLVKNSWGTVWGMEGYFKISRANNMCGIQTQPSYPTIVS